MKRKLSIYLILLLAIITSSCVQQGGPKRIILAHGLPVGMPVHQAMVFLADRIEELSEGQLAIDVFPNEQLGTERQLLELLQVGAVGITKVSGAVMENFSPRMKILGLPYVFRSREHSFAFMDSELGKELLEESRKYYLLGLAYYDAGSRSFYTKDKRVEKPEDLEGLKIRVQESQTAITLVNSLGGKATPISWGEIYSSLQQGIVDGAENNPPSFHSSGHYEVCKYYILNQHTYVPDVLVMSTHVWDGLNDEEKKWLKQAVEESVDYERKVWAAAEQASLDAVEAAGVEIIRPDIGPFADRLQDMQEAFKDDASIYSLIQQIRAMYKPEATVQEDSVMTN